MLTSSYILGWAKGVCCSPRWSPTKPQWGLEAICPPLSSLHCLLSRLYECLEWLGWPLPGEADVEKGESSVKGGCDSGGTVGSSRAPLSQRQNNQLAPQSNVAPSLLSLSTLPSLSFLLLSFSFCHSLYLCFFLSFFWFLTALLFSLPLSRSLCFCFCASAHSTQVGGGEHGIYFLINTGAHYEGRALLCQVSLVGH